MKLYKAMGMRPGVVAAFIGAGGKTTAIWRAQADLASKGLPAIFTTTTKIMEPVLPRDMALVLASRPDAGRIAGLLVRVPRLVVGSRRLDDAYVPLEGHPVPSRTCKLEGLAPNVLDDLTPRLPGVTWLVEADGARGCHLKLHAPHEPVVPACAGLVAVLAHLDGVGQPFDERTVHRAADAEAFWGAPQGTSVTPTMFAAVLIETLVRARLPDGCQVAALLTQRSPELNPAADEVAQRLLTSGYARVVAAALRTPQPVLQVWGG